VPVPTRSDLRQRGWTIHDEAAAPLGEGRDAHPGRIVPQNHEGVQRVARAAWSAPNVRSMQVLYCIVCTVSVAPLLVTEPNVFDTVAVNTAPLSDADTLGRV
jgi:hypothetical protein